MFGVVYISYHVLPNDCIQYRGEYENKEICPKFGHERYKESNNKDKLHGPLHNILIHMPIIPRSQRIEFVANN